MRVAWSLGRASCEAIHSSADAVSTAGRCVFAIEIAERSRSSLSRWSGHTNDNKRAASSGRATSMGEMSHPRLLIAVAPMRGTSGAFENQSPIKRSEELGSPMRNCPKHP